MDPVTLLVAALVAGAQAALKETAGAAIREAYGSLKALIVRKFGAQPSIEVLERAPTSKVKQASAQEDLTQAALDPEVKDLAKALLEAVKRDSPDTGKAIGIDLEHVTAEFLKAGNVTAKDTGVHVHHSEFPDGITIGDVMAGGAAALGPQKRKA